MNLASLLLFDGSWSLELYIVCLGKRLSRLWRIMLRDPRLRSSEQFGTRQWRKRLLAQKQRDLSFLAFVTAHYKLIREDWALNFRQRGHGDSNPFQASRTGYGPYKKGPQTKRQVQFNSNQWHDWNHQWVKHSQQFSKHSFYTPDFFFFPSILFQHKSQQSQKTWLVVMSMVFMTLTQSPHR